MPRRQSSIVAEANIKANIAGKSVPAPQLPGTDTTKARGAKRAATVDTATTTGPVSSAKRARKLPNVGDENAMKEKAEQGGVKGAKKTVVTRKKAAKAPGKSTGPYRVVSYSHGRNVRYEVQAGTLTSSKGEGGRRQEARSPYVLSSLAHQPTYSTASLHSAASRLSGIHNS